MMKDDAVLAAETFVMRKYPKLPEPVMVLHVTERENRVFVESWNRTPGAVRWRESAMWLDESSVEVAASARSITGKWIVHFFMSWDTDAVGMPMTLAVMIDETDGRVTQV